MKTSVVISIVIVIIVLVIGLFLQNDRDNREMATPGAQTKMIDGSDEGDLTTQSASSPSQPQQTIVYTSAGFNPSTLNVTPGQTVTFINNSTAPLWVASNPHPIHSAYREFDAMRGYIQNESYSFTFEKPGDWGFHNHLQAGHVGTITVN